MPGSRANIGSLVVNVLANVNPFERGLKKGSKRLASFEKRMKQTQKTMRRMKFAFGALGASLSAGGLIRSLQQTATEMDEIAKTSQKLGIATQNLIGLQFAAKRTGVESSTLNMALQRMTRRISEAAKGTGEAKDALRELGLNAERLAKRSPDEAFIAIARAFKQVENQSDKVRLAFKLFDSEGVNLVNTLALGESGLRKMAIEAKKLNVTFDEKEAKKVERFNDAMSDLSDSIRGAKTSIVIEVAPAAVRVVDDLARLLPEFNEGRKLGSGKATSKKLQGLQKFSTDIALAPFRAMMNASKRLEDQIIRDDIAAGVATQSDPSKRVKFNNRGQNLNLEQLRERHRRMFNIKGPVQPANEHIAALGKLALKADQAVGKLPDAIVSAVEKGIEFRKRVEKQVADAGIRFQARFHQNMVEFENNKFRREMAMKQEEAEALSGQGINEALERGTIAAFQAERRSNKVPQQQLNELRKINQQIANIEPVAIEQGGI